MKDEKYKYFKPTNWAVENKTSIYIISLIICLFGIITYLRLPKENFPEIVIPTIYVSTPYPGTSPVDMENLVTRPIEKEIKSISGVKKITSNSVQDFANVVIEFNTDIVPSEAKQLVKDAVDLQDRIEGLKEVTRADLVGALEREIQVNVNMYKAQVAQISLGDIERAINIENITMSA